MGKEKQPKKKKEKVTYIDDGRTLADMSLVGGAKRSKAESPRKEKVQPSLLKGSHSSLREQADTFFGAMRMMFFPMLVVIGIICIAFLILWLLL